MFISYICKCQAACTQWIKLSFSKHKNQILNITNLRDRQQGHFYKYHKKCMIKNMNVHIKIYCLKINKQNPDFTFDHYFQ